MPVNVQISLNPRNRWERLVVRIADTAAGDGRSLNNVAALLLQVVSRVDRELVRRHLGLATGGFTVRVGQQQLVLRMPLPSDPMCDCVLHLVEPFRHDRMHHLLEHLRGDTVPARVAGDADLPQEEALAEAA